MCEMHPNRCKMGVIVTMATEAVHTTAILGMWAKFHKIEFLHVASMLQLLSSYKNLDLCSFPAQNYAPFKIAYSRAYF